MKVWLHEVGHAVISLFPFEIVSEQEHAARLIKGNAHEVMRGAADCYPDYIWQMVEVAESRFVVEGTHK